VLTLRGADSSGTRNYYCLDENINVIEGYSGSSYTYRAKPANAIHKGDVVLPYCDSLGRLVAVLILYSHSGQTSYGDPTMLLTANGDRSSACFVGTVQRIEAPFMLFKERNSQENWVMSIRTDSGSRVVIYDTENQEARPGTYLDLMSSRGEVVIKANNSRIVTQIVVFI